MARISTTIRLDHRPKLVTFIQQLVTFILVAFALIIFRANTLGDAYYIITHLLDGMPGYLISVAREIIIALPSLDLRTYYTSLLEIMSPMVLGDNFDSFLVILAFASILVIEWTQFNLTKVSAKPVYVRWTVYIVFLAVALLLAVHSTLNKEFIYFQF